MAILNSCKLTNFAYLDCSIFSICCSGWVWEPFPTNKISKIQKKFVAILSMLIPHESTQINCEMPIWIDTIFSICCSGNGYGNHFQQTKFLLQFCLSGGYNQTLPYLSIVNHRLTWTICDTRTNTQTPLVAIISGNCPEITILDPLCRDDFQMQLLLI